MKINIQQRQIPETCTTTLPAEFELKIRCVGSLEECEALTKKTTGRYGDDQDVEVSFCGCGNDDVATAEGICTKCGKEVKEDRCEFTT